MKHIPAIVLLAAVASAPVFAKPCDQVQADIDAKIKAHGVKAYTLDLVPAAEVKDRKVVGSCEGGSKKIVYARGAAAAASADAPAKP